ncbi:MAG TPA: formyltransferase family protein, partial [Pseudomonadales bacterium]|nr:formyltransferase family protein [Pseudomonadales bacterium]
MARPSAVVFAYSGVGVRCLSAVLASGIEVALVVTHEDEPGENIWFDSVASLAGLHGIPVITPANPNDPEVIEQVNRCKPDWLFSFYYRRILHNALLSAASRGAYNMHGSLLPKFRGRSPINWAILKGETETGASLHRMVEKPDAGALVDQQSVPILPNDTAGRVYDRVACAAEIVLM